MILIVTLANSDIPDRSIAPIEYQHRCPAMYFLVVAIGKLLKLVPVISSINSECNNNLVAQIHARFSSIDAYK